MSTRSRLNRHIVAVVLATLSLVLASLAFGPSATAQDGELTPVCIQAFETAPYLDYLTDEQIAEIEATVDDGSDIPPPKIVGYPDPATGSCATVNGELPEYDPDVYTPICVPTGPDRDGPLVVEWALTHFLPAFDDPILADPVTGACPGDDDDTATGGDDASSVGDDDAASDGSGTTALPRTGSGPAASTASEQATPIAMLLAAAALCGAGIVTRRQRIA